jgi:hypothetical protein
MSRLSGFVLAALLFWGLEGAAHAQLVEADPPYFWPPADVYFYGYEPYGGFGVQYSQPLRDGQLLTDRFGMVYMVSAPRTAPQVEPAPLSASVPGSPRVRRSRSDKSAAQAQPRYHMPTGSLAWPGGNGGILYSPAMRYQSYGGGYAASPYGTIDHSIMYKGWALGY